MPELVAERYRVQELIGRGGVGEVYRVHDLRSGGSLALKCLIPEKVSHHSAQLMQEMLAREYRTLAELKHPSVVEVFEYGEFESRPFYTMELLQGQDLQELAPLPWQRACAYLRDIASCLALLHSRRLLYRDVSPRNVRCEQERAKLLDFGALTAMGPVDRIVGVPPAIPPEGLHGEILDGRYDLYALGAVLYWALTGRHAYPARTLRELPEVWLKRPAPPSYHAREVPEALDALILSLLSHEPQARPRNAAEVMEQLGRIAGLPDDESLHTRQAYVIVPTLHGRETEIARTYEALARVRGQRSRALWFEGEPGTGRSRLLAAILLEARLAGAATLRVSAADAPPADLALAGKLLRRAIDLLPHSTSSLESAKLLGKLDSTKELEQDARARLNEALRSVLRHACAEGPLAIAVDDADAVDRSSQAVLAGLTRGARRNLLLVFSSRTEPVLDGALGAVRADADPIILQPLSLAETEALLGSVFGEIPGLPEVTTRVYALSHGNPRATMELAEHLVATGKARYEQGSWVLPRELSQQDLPEAWTEALDRRFLSLPEDARELGELLAFSFEYDLSLEQIDGISSHRDPGRRGLALDRLLSEGLVRLDGEHARFVRGSDRERVCELADPQRAREIHQRLSEHLTEHGADPISVARCLLRAGAAGPAIVVLRVEIAKGTRCDTAPADYASILEEAIAAAPELGRPPADRFHLLRELGRVGDHLGVRGMPGHYAELFDRLKVDSGLTDYLALPDSLDPGERLNRALAAAQARYDALEPDQRVCTPIEGITTLALTARQAAAFGAISLDYDLLESIPDLHPFIPLSNALEYTVRHTIPASAHLTAARYEQARIDYGATRDRLMQPDRGGLDEEFWRWAMNALNFALGHINAGLCIVDAFEYAELLEADEAWKVGSWDIQRAYHLRQGNWREAEKCRDRIERLRLQSRRRPPMVDTSARLELDTSAHAGDLLGVRRATERLRELVALHPGYAAYAHYGPAVMEQLRGNHQVALEHIDRAIELAPAGRHPTWPWMVDCRLEILIALGRIQQAHADAIEYLKQSETVGLQLMSHHVALPLALIEAMLGDFESAVERVERGIEYREQLGIQGLNLGWAYETRARVAIYMRDQEAFVESAARCAREYGRGRGGSSLASRYEALRAEARQSGLLTISDIPPAPVAVTTAVSTLSTVLTQQTTLEERYSTALRLLIDASGARAGALYRLNENALESYAANPALSSLGPSSSGLDSSLPEPCVTNLKQLPPRDAIASLISAIEHEYDHDVTASEQLPADEMPTIIGEERWIPYAFGRMGDEGFELTGAALLCFSPSAQPRPLSAELREAVGRLLQR